MTTTIEALLESIRTRKSVSAFGIAAASAYLKSMDACVEGSCPKDLFQIADSELWKKEVADSANRLTYCGEDLESDLMQKSAYEGTNLSSGSVLEYDCVLSSRRKDRDGDILEQAGGMELDQKMPLLWQHIQLSPIGKHVKLLDQDETLTKSKFAIADTQLGRDAAVLVKMGALRKSHGFRPLEFSPVEIVKGADGKDYVRGWHVKKSYVFEGSLVSIPANPDSGILTTYEKQADGIMTAFSRDYLKSEPVKRWAKSVYDARPAQSPGFSLNTKSVSAELPADASGMDPTKIEKCPKCDSPMTTGGKCSKCDYIKEGPAKSADVPLMTKDAKPVENKAFAQSLTVKSYGDNPYLEGSYESLQWELSNSLDRFFMAKGVMTELYNGYSFISATFPSEVIAAYRKDGKSSFYRIAYSIGEDGVPTFTGDCKAVELKTSVVEKMLSDVMTKSAKFTPPAPLPMKKTITQMAQELLAAAAVLSSDASTQKALDDVASMAQLKRQESEERELKEFFGLN